MQDKKTPIKCNSLITHLSSPGIVYIVTISIAKSSGTHKNTEQNHNKNNPDDEYIKKRRWQAININIIYE